MSFTNKKKRHKGKVIEEVSKAQLKVGHLDTCP